MQRWNFKRFRKKKNRGKVVKLDKRNRGYFDGIVRIKTIFISVHHYFFVFSVLFCDIEYVDIKKNLWN